MLFSWYQMSEMVEPYSHLARIYDHVMRHVNYAMWAEYLSRQFERAPIGVKRVLDISCGTASLLIRLSQLNYRVDGFDRSLPMLRIARQKVAAARVSAQLWQASMLDFSLVHPYDAVVCTYDSLNYCRSLAECRRVFASVSGILRPGGVFVFDICTEKNSRKHFQNYYERDETDTAEYIRKSFYNPSDRTQKNEFIIRWHDLPGKLFREEHVQQIYRLREMRALITYSPFTMLGAYDGFSLRPGSEKSDRVHFVLVKEG